jgi:hypothetical protein
MDEPLPEDLDPVTLPELSRRSLARFRENMIDCEIAVDDARQAVDAAVEHLRIAVCERDRAVRHLQDLESLLVRLPRWLQQEASEPPPGTAA